MKRSQRKVYMRLWCLCFLCALAAYIPTEAIRSNAASFDRAVITVTADGKTFTYRDERMPEPDHTVYEQIAHRNINAPLKDKIKTVDKCLAAGAQWQEAMRYAFPRLPEFVQGICKQINRSATDSEIEFRPDATPMFRISRERDGQCVDEKRLYQDMYLGLRKSPEVRIVLTPQCVHPQVTVRDNVRLTQKISSFSTSFATSAEGRKNNIRLALRKLNGAVLAAGETFSFNARVGERSQKNGFSVAKIIVGGEYVEGMGGGVCQASTTLYNAALTAGMKITAVRNHSILPSYVSPSRDAMVNASSSDLQFVNPYETPVFIRAHCVGDTAHISFYGAALPHRIQVVSRETGRKPVPQDREITDTEHKYVPVDAQEGTRVRVSYGHPEVKSEAYLRYFSPEGKLLREEKIRSDTYYETQGVVAVAPKSAT